MRIAGYTSTGSKRPGVLWDGSPDGVPLRMRRAHGCTVEDEAGRPFLDWIMGLGAVALGYAHPAVTAAVAEAAADGVTGPLPPVLEEEVAALLADRIPAMQRIRFLKTGAEAMAAAVRLSRVATGRERVLGCGYHGWLDWSSDTEGVPEAVRGLFATIPFNDVERGRAAIRGAGDRLACVTVEPVVDGSPTREWLGMLREETEAVGALLVLDEIKTAFRLAPGGATEVYGLRPDLLVVGKAFANGLPLAAVGGRMEVMERVDRTWISSTLATETVALAAARTTMTTMTREHVPAHLARIGGRLFEGLHQLADRFPDLVAGVPGIPVMCYLHWRADGIGQRVVSECARRGVLFKRSAYNFASLAHGEAEVDRTLAVLGTVLEEAV